MHPLGEDNENEWGKRKLPKKTNDKKQTTFLQNWKCINKLKSASQKKKRIKAHFLCKTIQFFLQCHLFLIQVK